MRDLLRLARPTHWVKNAFVAAPLLFVLPDPFWPAALRCLLAIAAFSLVASAIYALNDVVDADADRAHPTKRHRPVAAGRIGAAVAVAWAAALAAGAVALSWATLPMAVLAALAAYAGNNLAYNLLLKQHRIADVISIAIGFVIRLVAGSIAIGVAPSSWLLVCGFSLALFLGFGKRRSELALAESGHAYRPVLRVYSPGKLDSLMSISAGLTLICYMLYTVAPETQRTHQTANLVYTVPPVFYAIFRFIFKVQDAQGESPEELLLHDPVMLATGALWAVMVVAVLTLR
jgi:4-hydroxybenzoate polyprenyltransferase